MPLISEKVFFCPAESASKSRSLIGPIALVSHVVIGCLTAELPTETRNLISAFTIRF